MPINQYDSQPDRAAAATPPGIAERLARLTAGDEKLREQSLHIQALGGRLGDLAQRLGTTDLAKVQDGLATLTAAAPQTERRLGGVEARAQEAARDWAQLRGDVTPLMQQVQTLHADLATLQRHHEALAKTLDHRVDDAFARMAHLQDALSSLSERVDDCCGGEFRSPPSPGKRNKSGA